jgi:hypothetical protein
LLEKNNKLLPNNKTERRISRASRGNLFELVESLLTNPKYNEIFLETSLDLYNTNKYQKFLVYSITFELSRSAHRGDLDDSVFDYYSEHSTTILDEITNTPFSFITHLYSIKDPDIFIPEMLRFIKLYKINSIFKSYSPLYNSWNYIPLVKYALIIFLQEKQYHELTDYINTINSGRLRRDIFLYKTVTTFDNFFFSLGSEKLKNIIIASEEEKDYITRTLLLIIFICGTMYDIKYTNNFNKNQLNINSDYLSPIKKLELKEKVLEIINFEIELTKATEQIVEIVKVEL